MNRSAQERAFSAASLDFRRLFEGAPGACLVLAPDPEFTILAANDAWLRTTRTERDAIVGRGLFEVVPGSPGDPHATGALRASLERLLAGNTSDAMPVQKHAIRDAESGGVDERYSRPVNSAVVSDTGEILYLIHYLEDVTDLVRASRRQERELDEAQRELESFTYSVSHDLRAPLRAVDGFSRILEEDYGKQLDGEGLRVLSVIRESSTRMGRLMEEVLAFSRLGRKPMSPGVIDMSRMAREAFQDACAAAKRKPELLLQPLPPAHGDAPLMKEVWGNLLMNAVKFSAPRERAEIEVSGRENGAQCIYSVRDNGVGFDMRYHDKAFGMFQRLHPETEFPGSGVGLAIVQRIVTRHGGRVWGESTVGAGATFHFSLPKG
jgi:signal transduction histidine kinase